MQNNDDKGGDSLRAIRIQQTKKRKRVNDEPELLTLSSDSEDNDSGTGFTVTDFNTNLNLFMRFLKRNTGLPAYSDSAGTAKKSVTVS